MGMWRLYRGCEEVVLWVCEGCLEGMGTQSGGWGKAVWSVWVGCLEDVGAVLWVCGGCLKGVRRFSRGSGSMSGRCGEDI